MSELSSPDSRVEYYRSLNLNPVEVDSENADRYEIHRTQAMNVEDAEDKQKRQNGLFMNTEAATGVTLSQDGTPEGNNFAQRGSMNQLSLAEKLVYNASIDLGQAGLVLAMAQSRYNKESKDDATYAEAYRDTLHQNALHDDALREAARSGVDISTGE